MRINVRENWYRDVWLLIITLVALYAAWHAQDAASRIQAQRHTTILASCQDQNGRHDATISTLHANAQHALTASALRSLQQELAAIGIHASLPALQRFERLAASQNAQSVALINALAPRQDCQALVAAATHGN